ncbi:MAG: hypothetical protein KJ063_24755 [Anaerolineae bacterium]|nr:hypothetical protein [Anaerolineae bacterium]
MYTKLYRSMIFNIITYVQTYTRGGDYRAKFTFWIVGWRIRLPMGRSKEERRNIDLGFLT